MFTIYFNLSDWLTTMKPPYVQGASIHVINTWFVFSFEVDTFFPTNPPPIEQRPCPGYTFKKFLILYQRKHNEKLLIYNKILPDDFHAVNSCCLPTNSPSRIDVLVKGGMAPAVNGSNLHGTNRFVEAGCLHVEKNHRGRRSHFQFLRPSRSSMSKRSAIPFQPVATMTTLIEFSLFNFLILSADCRVAPETEFSASL